MSCTMPQPSAAADASTPVRSAALVILGPTAGGKSSLAIELARRLPSAGLGAGEVISADSMQVYRGMDIGTAKTPAHERGGVPHHLIDLVEPSDDSFSVDRWLELCRQTIDDIRARGKVAIVVGGTNLYVQALVGGLADELPPPDEELRERLNAMEPQRLRARLAEVDPAAAERIHVNDRKRTIRAIEVFEQTGSTLSAMHSQWERSPHTAVGQTRSSTFIVGLEYPVEVINRRINARVKGMIEAGLIDEVRGLLEGGRLGRNAREALGYKQIIDHLEGRMSLEEAIEQIKIRTRRYAKQQRTWLRRFRAWQPSAWLDAAEQSTQSLADQALAAIEHSRGEPG